MPAEGFKSCIRTREGYDICEEKGLECPRITIFGARKLLNARSHIRRPQKNKRRVCSAVNLGV